MPTSGPTPVSRYNAQKEDTADMLWIKALHLIFVVAWFAGLFYLPRLFVYHADTPEEAGQARFRVMERRLYALTTIGGSVAIVLGLTLLALEPGLSRLGWMRAKLVLVALLLGYHAWCGFLVAAFARGQTLHSARWYRVFNELPTFFLAAIVILVIVRPF
jgi:protoporphyrinogen IX oxidase